MAAKETKAKNKAKNIEVIDIDKRDIEITKPEVKTVTVEIEDLNIRKGPGKSFESIGFTGVGTFEIVAEKEGEGSTKGWGRLSNINGWISLDFVK